MTTTEILPIDPAIRALGLLRQLTAEREALRAENQRLKHKTFAAGDPRLEAFWERSAEIAEEERFCSDYEDIVERMGGTPRRERELEFEFEVNVSMTVSVTATAYTENIAEEIAREEIGCYEIEEQLSDQIYDYEVGYRV